MLSDPYRIVLIGGFTFLLLICGLLIFRFAFPKRKINYLLLVLLFSLLPVLSIFRQGIYESGDFTIHVYEAMSFYDNLKEGTLIPRWGGDLNATYGYPVFLFAYPLPNYLISLPHFLGLSFILSLKLFLALSFVVSGVTMFLFAREFVNKASAFTAAIFYLFAPYHLVDLHFRADIGEVLAFVFLPLCLLFIKKIFDKVSLKWVILESLSLAGLILSHQAVSLTFFPILIAYVGFLFLTKYKKNMRALFLAIFSIILGLGIASYYWVPVVAEKIYTKSGIFPKQVSFADPLLYIVSPWKFGFLFQGLGGELSYMIGYVQIIVILLTLLFIWIVKKEKIVKQHVLFFLVFFFLGLFMVQKQSSFIWTAFPVLNNMQFSYRLSGVIAFIVAAIAGFASQFLKKTVVWLFVFLAVGVTILNWGNRKMITQVSDASLRKHLPYSTAEDEGNGQTVTKWVSSEHPWFAKLPKSHLEVVSGNGSTVQLMRTNTHHEYIIHVASMSQFKENTVFFPGWTLLVNGKKYPINYTNGLDPGVIRFSLPKGNYKVDLEFIDTPVRAFANMLSMITILFIASLVFIKFKFAKVFYKY